MMTHHNEFVMIKLNVFIFQEDKMAALELLSHITVAGRRYKELLCESYG